MRNIKLTHNISLINKRFKKNQFYHYLKVPNISIVVPKINNKFIIIRQKREPINKKNYEFPSGNIEINESASQSANKELLEETGYKSKKKLKKILTFYTEPGRLTSKIYSYFSNSLIKIHKPERGIEIKFVSKEQLINLIKKGDFNNSSHITVFFSYLLKNNF